MKKVKFLPVLILSLGLFGIFSFAPASSQLFPTKLRVTVLDGLGNATESATVVLYASQEDYRDSKNAISTQMTDKKGRVVFTELKPQPYFIDATKGDMNNDGEGVRTSTLDEGKLNKVNTVIE
ncbi:MAG: hypothetical protein ACI83W_001955 [Marinoscillum sp.]|jgi:uncharacterized protein (DUF2141 family)